MNRKKKALAAFLLAFVLWAALPLHAFAEIAPPEDVPPPVEHGGSNTAWYANAVYDLYYSGVCWDIMDGEDIAPGKVMTRGELVVLLRELAWYASKLERSQEGAENGLPSLYYTDSNGRRYTDALDWAVQNGILKGDGTGLAPNRGLTRQEMAVILMRFADYMGLELRKTDGYGMPLEKLFCDARQVSRWAKSAVEEAAWHGFIRGSERFGGFYDPETGVSACGIVPYMDPQTAVTRAQGYQAVWNYTQAAGIYLMWRNEFADWRRWSAE